MESSWDERNLWIGSVDWQCSAESTTPISWHGNVLPVEELGAFPWSCDSPNSWRAVTTRDTFENISENIDIHDLLERLFLFIYLFIYSFAFFEGKGKICF